MPTSQQYGDAVNALLEEILQRLADLEDCAADHIAIDTAPSARGRLQNRVRERRKRREEE